jgi:hypothetical protein
MEETIGQIKEVQKAVLDEDDSSNDKGDDDQTGGDDGVLKDLAGTDIPDAFTEAAEAADMSPSEIIALADKHTDEELLEMIPTLQESVKGQDGEEVNKDVDQSGEKVNKDIDKDAEPSEAEKQMLERITKQLEEKFGTSLKEIEDFKASQEEQSTKQMVDRASELLDKASKDFPVFGKTDELPKFTSGRLAGQLIPTSPAMKARLEVLRYADSFMASGADIDDAMANALATYKGLHLEKELERKQVRDLKRHEVKLSGARVGKETSKKYADTREEIIDEIKALKRRAGVD